MKKFAGFLIAFCLVITICNAQKDLSNCSSTTNEFHFTGKAPAPWSIDGSITDWEAILSKRKSNPAKPFIPPATTQNNVYNDGDPTDLDDPGKKADIQLVAYTYDSYNVYFYVRLLHKSNETNTLYFFMDVNVDGFLNEGEPVIMASFDHKKVTVLQVASYVPNKEVDYIENKGNFLLSPMSPSPALPPFLADGYTVKGSVLPEVKAGQQTGAFTLKEGEVFNAAVTENGNGLELAIPWSYIRNYSNLSAPLNEHSLFLYHIALQEGSETYNPALVSDNAGNTQELNLHAGRVGSPTACVQNKTVTKTGATTYRFTLQLYNPTQIVEQIGISRIEFSNIKVTGDQSFSSDGFLVTVTPDQNCDASTEKEEATTFVYGAGSSSQPPIIYRSQTMLTTYRAVKPGEYACLIIDVTLPAGVQSATVSIIPGIKLDIDALQIGASTLDEGGKPINPIGFSIGDDFSTFQMQKNIPVTETTKSVFNVFPNPGKGSLYVLLPTVSGKEKVQLVNEEGKVVQQWISVNKQRFEINGLKRGVYILQITSPSGLKASKKILVE
jgi:hypothetical protein